MKSLRRPFQHGIERLAAELRVAVLHDTTAAERLAGDAAIVSPLVAVRLYAPPPGSVARRRRVHLDGPEGRVTLLAHLRDGLFEPGPQLQAVQWATVGRVAAGERRPVAWADPATRSVQLALRPQTATVAEASTGGHDPGETATRYLVREPLAALQRLDGEPLIGDGVVTSTRELMQRSRVSRARLVRDELTLIERWAASDRRRGAMPVSMRRRADRLRRWLEAHGGRTDSPTEAEAVDEVARLVCLITSRACSGLEVSGDGIRGLMSPRINRRGQRHRALFFRLRVGRGHGELSLWDNDAFRGRGAVQCLGDGEMVLRAAMQRADVYGMVDMILNYVESNRVGTLPDDLHAIF